MIEKSRALAKTLPVVLSAWCVLHISTGCDDGDGGSQENAKLDENARVEDSQGGKENQTESDLATDDLGTGDAASPDDSDEDGSQPQDICEALREGWNVGFDVGGVKRDFKLVLPEGAASGGPWPVVFLWHNLGVPLESWEPFLAPYVNAEEFPFILVLPNDKGAPVLGLVDMEWDMLKVTDPEENKEVMLFDAIIESLDACYGVDFNHIHSVAFSSGAIVTDLLVTYRADVLASVFTYSGAYFSNPKNIDALPAMFRPLVSWPEATHSEKPVQIMVTGGDNDQWQIIPGMANMAIDFRQFHLNDVPFVTGQGRDVIVCGHDLGHAAPPPDMPMHVALEFFKEHPLGTEISPYATEGLPASFSPTCEYLPGSN